MACRLRAQGVVPRGRPRSELSGRPHPEDDAPRRFTAAGLLDPTPLKTDLLTRPVEEVARALLGARLVSTIAGTRCVGVIVETEAYGGAEDPASHAATRTGITARNRAMFGPAGHAYVYRSYGVHWCLNVVTGPEGEGQAVLLRGLEPIEGIEVMQARRSGRAPIAAGPGRLAQAMGIDDALYGHRLDRAPLLLASGWTIPDRDVVVTGRVGVTAAADWPLRFYVAGSPGVSAPSARPRDPDSA